MSDRVPEPGNAGDEPGIEPDLSATAEFAETRAATPVIGKAQGKAGGHAGPA